MPWGISFPWPAEPKSWSKVSTVSAVTVVLERCKFPRSSFFFVSIEITASPVASYSRRRCAMFSNCALRSGWWPMVFFFRAVRQPICSFRSSRRMVRRLAGVPIATRRRDNSRNDRLVHSTPSRIGSPAVNSCNKWRRFSSKAGWATARGGRPPLFFGCAPPPHPLPPPTRGGLDEWFSDRTPTPVRYTPRRHAPAWPPQRPHTDGDPSPTATRRTAASSVRPRLHSRPCHTPCSRISSVGRILRLQQSGKLFLTISLAVNAADKTITFKIETATFPNWDGTEQKRAFTVTGDELTYTVPAASGGGTATTVWKRAK